MTVGREIATTLDRQFPKAATRTLALKAYKENPGVWPTVEAARTAIRIVRGASGKELRKYQAPDARGPQKSGDPFGHIPEGKTHFDQWSAAQFNGPMRCLVLSDIHMPYHDRNALVTALNWGKANNVDTILLNGDTADFFSVSFWEKDPRKRRLKDEIDTVSGFMAGLRHAFPNARIIVKDGNHEERWERYMFVKAPELIGIPDFDANKILGLDYYKEENGEKVLVRGNLGIEPSIGEKRPIRLGLLNVIHGHEYRFAIQNPVNPARGLFLRTKAHCICGHFHQSSYHTETTVEEQNVACWSTGCLCDMHPDYMPLNKWNHGFAFVEVDREGKFEVKNMVIIKGKVY